MKTQCSQTNCIQHSLGKEKLEKLGEEKKVLALIKSLIYVRERKEALGARYERSIKVDRECRQRKVWNRETESVRNLGQWLPTWGTGPD